MTHGLGRDSSECFFVEAGHHSQTDSFVAPNERYSSIQGCLNPDFASYQALVFRELLLGVDLLYFPWGIGVGHVATSVLKGWDYLTLDREISVVLRKFEFQATALREFL